MDTLIGDTGMDFLRGGADNDFLDGGDDNDNLRGDGGVDQLTGGTGNDVLSGGAQSDLFIFADGFDQDIITDFDATDDQEKINLTAVSTITSFTDLITSHATQVGNRVIIDALNGDTIQLNSVMLSDLDANDFVF